MTKQLPNMISVSRGLAAIGLLFTSTFRAPFWSLYAWCGLSDMIDGPLARRLGAESRTGAVVDSLADLIFVIAAMIKILPMLVIPGWIWGWIAAIAVIRVTNIVLGYARRNCFVLLHTPANKLTGLLLFLLPVAICFVNQTACMITVCIAATFASVQEGAKLLR